MTEARDTSAQRSAVTVQFSAPPADVASLPLDMIPTDGRWFRFDSERGHAQVFVSNQSAAGLLHWIEVDPASRGLGHATALLDAIGAWADHLHLPMTLLCDDTLIGFYRERGWGWAGSPSYGGNVMVRVAN